MAGLAHIPLFSGISGVNQNFLKSCLHLGLKVAQVVFDSTVADERSREFDILLTILGVHTEGSLVGLRAGHVEHAVFQTIKAIADLGVDDHGVVAVRENIQKGLVGNEIEAREDLLLLFKIGIQGLLASLDILMHTVKGLEAAFEAASLYDVVVFNSIAHKLFPVEVDLFETLGVIRQLGTNILRGEENRVETGPVLLHLAPDVNNLIDLLEGLLPLGHVLLELLDFLGSHHCHQFKGLGLDELNNSSELTKDVGIALLLEGEELVVPGLGNIVDFALDLGFLLSAINDLSHLLRVLVEVELNKILHAELGGGVVNVLASHVHELLPVTRHHELRVKLSNQRQHGVHVLDTVVKSHKAAPLADDLVLRGGGVALLRLHVLDKRSQVVSVDLVPESLLPGVKLVVNKSNQVPHFLERDELVLAVLESFVVGALHVEQ